jgi:hypothetical protein
MKICSVYTWKSIADTCKSITNNQLIHGSISLVIRLCMEVNDIIEAMLDFFMSKNG